MVVAMDRDIIGVKLPVQSNVGALNVASAAWHVRNGACIGEIIKPQFLGHCPDPSAEIVLAQ